MYIGAGAGSGRGSGTDEVGREVVGMGAGEGGEETSDSPFSIAIIGREGLMSGAGIVSVFRGVSSPLVISM